MKMIIANNKHSEEIKKFINVILTDIFKVEARGLEDLDNIEKNFSIFYLLIEKDEIIGTIGLKDEGDARLVRMYINKEIRGKGYGKKMVDKIIRYCKGKHTRIFLTTYDKMNSEGFYNKVGFNTFKKEKENGITKIWMERKL